MLVYDLIFGLFRPIHHLFDDALSSSDSVASDEIMING